MTICTEGWHWDTIEGAWASKRAEHPRDSRCDHVQCQFAVWVQLCDMVDRGLGFTERREEFNEILIKMFGDS